MQNNCLKLKIIAQQSIVPRIFHTKQKCFRNRRKETIKIKPCNRTYRESVLFTSASVALWSTYQTLAADKTAASVDVVTASVDASTLSVDSSTSPVDEGATSLHVARGSVDGVTESL